jgi:hypothetical protein
MPATTRSTRASTSRQPAKGRANGTSSRQPSGNGRASNGKAHRHPQAEREQPHQQGHQLLAGRADVQRSPGPDP